MIDVFTNDEFGGSSSGCCCILHAHCSTSPQMSNKIQGICHGAASGCSVRGHVLCTVPVPIAFVAAVAYPPPSSPLPSLLPPLPIALFVARHLNAIAIAHFYALAIAIIAAVACTAPSLP
jgi:hypothetical protein